MNLLKTNKKKHSSLITLSVKIIALLAVVMGLVNLTSAIMPALSNRLDVLKTILPFEVRHGGRITTALAGFALLIVARNLWRRKRVAWFIALIALFVSLISHMVKGLDFEEASFSLILIIWLVLMAPYYHTRSDPPSIKQGVFVLAFSLIFTLFYGTIGFWLLDEHFSINFDLWAALRQTVVMFTEFYNPGLEPITSYGRYFGFSIYIIGFSTLNYAVFTLLRPIILRNPTTPQERERARKIVEAFGQSPFARINLFDDKTYYFSPAGSLVAYIVKDRVALTLGDPIGPGDDFNSAVSGFSALCQRNDWIPVFCAANADRLEQYHTAGFKSVCIGQEGIVDLKNFTLEGSAAKDLRYVYNRYIRSGNHFEVYPPPIPDNLLEELHEISDEWLTMKHSSEQRFAIGWFDEAYLRECFIAVITTPEGTHNAFVNLVPEYQCNETSIDLMRHRMEIDHGIMEFLFISLFKWAKEQGYNTFSLGLSALSGIGEKSNDPLAERAMHEIYENINQFYNFKGLHEFKEKFHPRWEPRYFVLPSMANLINALMAFVNATSGFPGLLGKFNKHKK